MPFSQQEGDYYRVPPMQFCNSKEGLTQLLQNNLAKTYKRKRLKLDDDKKPPSIDNIKDDDMDIQESDEEKSNSPVLFPQPRPSASLGADAVADADETNSNTLSEDVLEASLLELKRKQEEILKALEDASSDSNSSPMSPNQNGEPNDVEESRENAIEAPTESNIEEKVDEQSMLETTIKTIKISEASVSLTETALSTPTAPVAGRSRESVFGTPLIKQVSPFSKLPIGDKWSVGVTDVIDFENLPDATGTYQKLNGVIRKIRTKIKEINDDNDEPGSS